MGSEESRALPGRRVRWVKPAPKALRDPPACPEPGALLGPWGRPAHRVRRGDVAYLDDATLTAIGQQLREESAVDLRQARAEDSERLEKFVLDAIAGAKTTAAKEKSATAPHKYEPAAYTQYFVKEAIRKYQEEGLDAAVAHYNTPESIDGQWYMFIYDQDDILLAHAAIPDYVGLHASKTVGPLNFPAGDAVVAVADEDGAWFSYTFTNPATGTVQAKHSWMVQVDGLTFGSGWYERGPSKADAPAYTRDFVARAINLYNAIGREGTVDYYKLRESVDGQWYVFIIDGDGYTISHHNPMFIGRDPQPPRRRHGPLLRRRPPERDRVGQVGRLRAAEPGDGR